MSKLTAEHIKILSAPFDQVTLGVKLNSFSRDKTKAMLVVYLQHTDVYVRIEQVDPAWTCETMDVREGKDGVSVRVKITILGVSRDNWGDGQDLKSANSDAIKRAAMLFGIGRYLYDAETVWIPYNENQDKFKTYTYADYKGGLRQGQAQLPVGPSAPPAATKPGPVVVPKKAKTPAEVSQEINEAAEALGLTKPDMYQWAEEVAGKTAAQMNLADMEKFLAVLQGELGRKGQAV